jgi:hypothetical protein
MVDPIDELSTLDSEARAYREEQMRQNDEWADPRREAADMAGMPLHERFRP